MSNPDEKPDTEQPAEETASPPKAQWQYQNMRDWGINKQTANVIRLTIGACEAELDQLRRKLEKLTYGS